MATQTKKFLFKSWTDNAFLDEDGLIVIQRVTNWEDRCLHFWADPMKELMKKYGYRTISEDMVRPILYKHIGQNMKAVVEYLKRHEEKLMKQRETRQLEEQAWEKLRKRFEGKVIGIDDIDIYEQGITISILLNSFYRFYEQQAFVKENKRDLARFVQEELANTKGVPRPMRQKAIDLLPFCRLSELVLTRRNRLELKYDLKDGVIKALEDSVHP